MSSILVVDGILRTIDVDSWLTEDIGPSYGVVVMSEYAVL